MRADARQRVWSGAGCNPALRIATWRPTGTGNGPLDWKGRVRGTIHLYCVATNTRDRKMDPAGLRTMETGVRPGTPTAQLRGAVGHPCSDDGGSSEEGTVNSELGKIKQKGLSRNQSRATQQKNFNQVGAFNIVRIGPKTTTMGPFNLNPSFCIPSTV